VCTASATNTIEPPISAGTPGYSATKIHTQIGPTIGSIIESRATSVAGAWAAPMLNTARPMPSWAKPNVISSTRSCVEMSKGWANGTEIKQLNPADSNIAGAIAISEWRRIMTVPNPNAIGMIRAINAPAAEPPAPGPDTMKATPATVVPIAIQV